MKKISKRQFFRSGLLSLKDAVSGFNPAEGITNKLFDLGGVNKTHAEGPGKFSMESPWYEATSKGALCLICPNECVLREGGEGICRTHVVKDDKFYTIAYGNPCSVHSDPIEKKPLFHFLPASKSFSIATAGCNLSCLNCQNWEISQRSPKDTSNLDMFPEQVVRQAVKAGCKSIAFTYTEPVAFYEYVFDTSRLARDRGLKNLFISNGYINERPLRSLCKYLDAANIDLKSFSAETYSKLNGGSLKPILNSLEILKEEGVWLEITNLVIPGYNDNMTMIAEMCEWLAANGFEDNPLHFSRFHPLYKLDSLESTPLETLERARDIALKAGIRYVYLGNVPGSSAQNTHCPDCNKVIIERQGFTILSKNMNGNACGFCNAEIAGVWE
ncbi:MAG: AmmeMemoRadiSam system radical SAM enzyme [bacterium]